MLERIKRESSKPTDHPDLAFSKSKTVFDLEQELGNIALQVERSQNLEHQIKNEIRARERQAHPIEMSNLAMQLSAQQTEVVRHVYKDISKELESAEGILNNLNNEVEDATENWGELKVTTEDFEINLPNEFPMFEKVPGIVSKLNDSIHDLTKNVSSDFDELKFAGLDYADSFDIVLKKYGKMAVQMVADGKKFNQAVHPKIVELANAWTGFALTAQAAGVSMEDFTKLTGDQMDQVTTIVEGVVSEFDYSMDDLKNLNEEDWQEVHDAIVKKLQEVKDKFPEISEEWEKTTKRAEPKNFKNHHISLQTYLENRMIMGKNKEVRGRTCNAA